jgi:hypothetical protein
LYKFLSELASACPAQRLFYLSGVQPTTADTNHKQCLGLTIFYLLYSVFCLPPLKLALSRTCFGISANYTLKLVRCFLSDSQPRRSRRPQRKSRCSSGEIIYLYYTISYRHNLILSELCVLGGKKHEFCLNYHIYIWTFAMICSP